MSLGTAFVFLKKYDDAVKQFEYVIKIKPEDDVAHGNMGIVLSQLKRYDEAIEHFNKAIK